jgi:hypothetical protein
MRQVIGEILPMAPGVAISPMSVLLLVIGVAIFGKGLAGL